MMHLRTVASIMSTLLMIHLNIMITTDCMHGSRDPFGPYPRIPDKEKIQKEIEFAEECRKFITPPLQKFY